VLDLLDTAYHEYWSMDGSDLAASLRTELDNVRAAIDWAAATIARSGLHCMGQLGPCSSRRTLRGRPRSIRTGGNASVRQRCPATVLAASGRRWPPMTRRGNATARDMHRACAKCIPPRATFDRITTH